MRGLIGALVLGAIVWHFLPWILAAFAIAVAYRVGQRLWLAQQAADEAERKRQAEIRARADQHLQWWTAGDERALYGEAGAALMREIGTV